LIRKPPSKIGFDMQSKSDEVAFKDSPGQADELEGVYANTFQVGYNNYEFVLDFGQYFTGNDKDRFHTRIVTNPQYVEHLLEVLSESISKYKSGRK